MCFILFDLPFMTLMFEEIGKKNFFKTNFKFPKGLNSTNEVTVTIFKNKTNFLMGHVLMLLNIIFSHMK